MNIVTLSIKITTSYNQKIHLAKQPSQFHNQ